MHVCGKRPDEFSLPTLSECVNALATPCIGGAVVLDAWDSFSAAADCASLQKGYPSSLESLDFPQASLGQTPSKSESYCMDKPLGQELLTLIVSLLKSSSLVHAE